MYPEPWNWKMSLTMLCLGGYPGKLQFLPLNSGMIQCSGSAMEQLFEQNTVFSAPVNGPQPSYLPGLKLKEGAGSSSIP